MYYVYARVRLKRVQEEGRLATSVARFHPVRTFRSGRFYDSSTRLVVLFDGKWRKVSMTKAASRKRNDVLLNEMRASVSRTFREYGDSFNRIMAA